MADGHSHGSGRSHGSHGSVERVPSRVSLRKPSADSGSGSTLEGIERRRIQLLGVMAFLLVALAMGMVLLSFEPGELLDGSTLPVNVIRVGLVLLAGAFAVYVIEKERHLRRVGAALVNERVVASALMNRLDEISLLAEAGRAVTSALDLRSALGVILAAASELFESDEGSVMIVENDELVIAAATGHAAWYLGQRRPITEGIGGFVLRSRQPMLIDGELEMAELSHMLGNPPQRTERVLSAISVPLIADDQPLGVLSLNIVQGDRRYEEYDLHTLELFAQQAALAIQQATVLKHERESLRVRMAEVDELRSGFLHRMAKVSHPAFGSASTVDPAGSDDREPITKSLHGKHVLLVDDDPALLRFLHEALAAEGCRVSLASDGKTAISRAEAEHPDLVVLDITLPVMDGWQVLAHIRELSRRPKVVCLTGKSTPRDRMKAWTLGADEYIAKPFEVPRLIAALADVARRTDTAQAERRDQALRNIFAG